MISGWLIRKWCEWSHVHSWTSVVMRFNDEGRLSSSRCLMHCVKCKRVWRTAYLDKVKEEVR